MRPLVIVFTILLLGGCANTDSIPGDILSKDKMETIIWQLVQSDEYANGRAAKDSTIKINAEKAKVYQQVFELNGTSMPEFKKSYAFYMEHPNISKEMFDSISARANRQHMELYTGKKDSLKPVPAVVSPLANSALILPKRDSVLKSRLSRIKARQDSAKYKKGIRIKKMRTDSLKPILQP